MSNCKNPCVFFWILVFFPNAFAWAAQDSPRSPSVQGPGGSIWKSYFKIHVPDNKKIYLSENTLLQVEEVEIDGQIITNGHELVIDSDRLKFGPRGKIIAFDNNTVVIPPTPGRGSPGRDGADGMDGTRRFDLEGPSAHNAFASAILRLSSLAFYLPKLRSKASELATNAEFLEKNLTAEIENHKKNSIKKTNPDSYETTSWYKERSKQLTLLKTELEKLRKELVPLTEEKKHLESIMDSLRDAYHITRNGYAGQPGGAPNTPGAAGKDGTSEPNPIRVFTADTMGSLFIDGTGQKGGQGQMGGMGGQGGDGGAGRPAEAKASLFSSETTPGGNGGDAGPGGPGGKGGPGGRGGRAVKIILTTPFEIKNDLLTILSQGGPGGDGGPAGLPGLPGNPGPGGPPAYDTSVNPFLEADASGGHPGRPSTQDPGSLGAGERGLQGEDVKTGSNKEIKNFHDLAKLRMQTIEAWYQFHWSRTFTLLFFDTLNLAANQQFSRKLIESSIEKSDSSRFSKDLIANINNDLTSQLIELWKTNLANPLQNDLQNNKNKNADRTKILQMSNQVIQILENFKNGSSSDVINNDMETLRVKQTILLDNSIENAVSACILLNQYKISNDSFLGTTRYFAIPVCQGKPNFRNREHLSDSILLTEDFDPKVNDSMKPFLIHTQPVQQQFLTAKLFDLGTFFRPILVAISNVVPSAFANENEGDFKTILKNFPPFSNQQIQWISHRQIGMPNTYGRLQGYHYPLESKMSLQVIRHYLHALSAYLHEGYSNDQ